MLTHAGGAIEESLPRPGLASASTVRTPARALTRAEVLVLVAFPLVKLAAHLAVRNGYGYHRDELYYLVCANHLGWGYVDHPPVSVFVLAALRAVLGSSAAATRIVAAAADTVAVALAGLMRRRHGGGVTCEAVAM